MGCFPRFADAFAKIAEERAAAGYRNPLRVIWFMDNTVVQGGIGSGYSPYALEFRGRITGFAVPIDVWVERASSGDMRADDPSRGITPVGFKSV